MGFVADHRPVLMRLLLLFETLAWQQCPAYSSLHHIVWLQLSAMVPLVEGVGVDLAEMALAGELAQLVVELLVIVVQFELLVLAVLVPAVQQLAVAAWLGLVAVAAELAEPDWPEPFAAPAVPFGPPQPPAALAAP